jgi:hypothetical protein
MEGHVYMVNMCMQDHLVNISTFWSKWFDLFVKMV